MTHKIKLRIDFCDAVLDGRKTFEIRENDRGYQTGDLVNFVPVDKMGLEMPHPVTDKTYRITYLLNGWLNMGTTPILVFTIIFVVGYLVIWAIIYSTVKKNTDRVNELLKMKQNGIADP